MNAFTRWVQRITGRSPTQREAQRISDLVAQIVVSHPLAPATAYDACRASPWHLATPGEQIRSSCVRLGGYWLGGEAHGTHQFLVFKEVGDWQIRAPILIFHNGWTQQGPWCATLEGFLREQLRLIERHKLLAAPTPREETFEAFREPAPEQFVHH